MNQETPKSARPRLLIVVGVLAVVAAVVAVLLVNSDEDPAAAAARPELKPLTLSAEPVWGAERVGLLSNGRSVNLRDGRLLIKTADDFQLLDVESGATLWKLGEFAELPGSTAALAPGRLPFLVRHGGGVGVLVEYELGCDPIEHGLALLSGETGGVVWQAPITPVEACAQNMVHWAQNLRAADDTTALVSIAPDFGFPAEVGQVRTLALDVATGQRKWAHQGAWPQAIAGGMALVSTSEPESSPIGPGTVTALDLATGQPTWSLADRYAEAHLTHVAGDVLVVATADESQEGKTVPDESKAGRAVRMLDAATGRELATLPGVQPGACVTDATLVACQTDPAGDVSVHAPLVTYRVADGAVQTTAPIEETWALRSVVQGRISVEFDGRKPSIVTIDRTGNVIDENPPGVLLAVVDDLLVVENGELRAIYRVQS